MTATLEHPSWCDDRYCLVADGGHHMGEPHYVTDTSNVFVGLSVALAAPAAPGPTRIRVTRCWDGVVVDWGDFSLDSSALLAAHIEVLLVEARPDEFQRDPMPDDDVLPVGGDERGRVEDTMVA
jgi:hypothetical protein